MHFGAIFLCVKKCRFASDFAFVHVDYHFRQYFFSLHALCAEFRIEYTDLHIKAVLTVHLSSESVQWFGRESRTKPFLQLIFIYIEIQESGRVMSNIAE